MNSSQETPMLPIGELVATPDPARPPERKLFEGRFISLEPLATDRHADALYDCSHGSPKKERLWAYLFNGPFESRAAMRALLEKQEASKEPLFFAVIDNERKSAVGMASYLNCIPAMRSIELGNIWYSPAVQRGKTNTEAMFLMLCHAFDDLGYRRVEWKCNALNEPSRRAARRLGFEFEGLFRQHMIIKQRNRDTAWYAMIDRDWPRIKRNMARWLYPTGPEDQAVSLSELNANR